MALPEMLKPTWVSCSGAWSAVMVSVADPPGEIVVPPVTWSVGTFSFLMVVSAELGVPTE